MAAVQIDEAVQIAPDGDGAVLLDCRDGQFYGVNRVGAAIVAEIQQGTRLGDIAVVVATRFKVDPETVDRDLKRFIADLATRGLCALSQ